jgi:hypothetical protein
VVAHWARAAHLGKLPILAGASLAAVAVTFAAAKAWPELFLGSHGTWASRQAEQLLRKASRRLPVSGAARNDGLTPAGEANTE